MTAFILISSGAKDVGRAPRLHLPGSCRPGRSCSMDRVAPRIIILDDSPSVFSPFRRFRQRVRDKRLERIERPRRLKGGGSWGKVETASIGSGLGKDIVVVPSAVTSSTNNRKLSSSAASSFFVSRFLSVVPSVRYVFAPIDPDSRRQQQQQQQQHRRENTPCVRDESYLRMHDCLVEKERKKRERRMAEGFAKGCGREKGRKEGRKEGKTEGKDFGSHTVRRRCHGDDRLSQGCDLPNPSLTPFSPVEQERTRGSQWFAYTFP